MVAVAVAVAVARRHGGETKLGGPASSFRIAAPHKQSTSSISKHYPLQSIYAPQCV